MSDNTELIAEAELHAEGYDFDKLEDGSWPWTMRGLVAAMRRAEAENARLRGPDSDERDALITDPLLVRIADLTARLAVAEAESEALTQQIAAVRAYGEKMRDAHGQSWCSMLGRDLLAIMSKHSDHSEHVTMTDARWADCLEGECDHVDEDGQPEDMSACPSLTVEVCVDCMAEYERGSDPHYWDDLPLAEWPCDHVAAHPEVESK